MSAQAVSPAQVEAENYTAYFDSTTGNQGSASCGTTDVDVEPSPDAGGGCQIGFTTANEWLEYQINVTTAGTYNVIFRASTNQ